MSWHLPRPDSHRLVVVSFQDAPLCVDRDGPSLAARADDGQLGKHAAQQAPVVAQALTAAHHEEILMTRRLQIQEIAENFVTRHDLSFGPSAWNF